MTLNSMPGITPESVARRMAEAKAALERLQQNPRVTKIVVVVPGDACQSCADIAGSYAKQDAPQLPMDACSHPLGCRSYYQPFIDELYP